MAAKSDVHRADVDDTRPGKLVAGSRQRCAPLLVPSRDRGTLRRPILARRRVEPAAKGTDEGLRVPKAAVRRDFSDRRLVGEETERGTLDTQSCDMSFRRLSECCLEHALQVIGRELRPAAEHREGEVPVEVCLDVDEKWRQRLPVVHQAVFVSARAAMPPAPSHAPASLRTNPPIMNGTAALESPGQSTRTAISMAR